MKNNLKGYFVVTLTEEIWEIPPKKKEELDKLYPDWVYTAEDEKLDQIYEFFKKNGKILGHSRVKNVLLGTW